MIKYLKVALIIAVIIGFLATLNFLITIYSADVLAEEASQLFSSNEYVDSLQLYTKAISKNPLEPRYYTGRAKTYLALTAGENESNTRTYKLLALEDLRTALELNPSNLLTVKSSISSYYFLATKDLTLPAGRENVDSTFAEVTQTFYKNIWERSTNDVGMYVLLYTYSNRLGFTDISAAARYKISDLRPDLLEWYNFN